MCKKDNALGGWCDKGSTLTDPNSKCFHGIVYCATRFNEMNGTCIKDGAVGGRCCVEEGTGCEKDPSGICVCGVCECPLGVQQVNGLCRKVSEGEMGGKCERGRCKGKELRCVEDVCVPCTD